MVLAGTSYNLTEVSQDETRRNWDVLGLNFTDEIPSSGGWFNLNSFDPVIWTKITKKLIVDFEEKFYKNSETELCHFSLENPYYNFIALNHIMNMN